MHPINVHETPAVSQVQCGLQQRAQELPTLLELVLRERRVLWMGSLCLLETSLGWMPSPQCGGNWRWSLWEVVGLGWGGESGVSVLGLAPLAGMKVPDLGCPCPRGHNEKLTVYKAGRGLPPNPTVGAPCPSAPSGLGRETQSGVCSAAQADWDSGCCVNGRVTETVERAVSVRRTFTCLSGAKGSICSALHGNTTKRNNEITQTDTQILKPMCGGRRRDKFWTQWLRLEARQER